MIFDDLYQEPTRHQDNDLFQGLHHYYFVKLKP